jgi:hypothetical protein
VQAGAKPSDVAAQQSEIDHAGRTDPRRGGSAASRARANTTPSSSTPCSCAWTRSRTSWPPHAGWPA